MITLSVSGCTPRKGFQKTMVIEGYQSLADALGGRGIDVDDVKNRLRQQAIETPSWGYADSGTRFGVFSQAGAAKTLAHKFEDAGTVHRFTGIAPSVALHIPWDKLDDWSQAKEMAEANGVTIGAINPNVFQDEVYCFGSFSNRDPEIRARALDRHLECVEIMKATGSDILSLWYADGTNYPGQSDIVKRKRWFQEGFQKTYDALPEGSRMLIEYKLFEPGFYHTDIADWGMAYCFATKLGEKAEVLVDLGHHAHGANIEHIVAFLIDEGKLGGFHFNDRRYADDDLTVGSVNPYQLFLIYDQIAAAELNPDVQTNIAFMVDQSHNIKPKVEAMIQTVVMCQRTYAKALCVDRKALAAAQAEDDVVAAEEVLVTAFNTDVEPLLQVVREEMGVPARPLQAYRESGTLAEVEAKRAHVQGGGGLGA